MYNEGIFLSVRKLMRLTGGNNYSSCANQHRAIRDILSSRKKRKLTIHEYCLFEQIDFEYVWKYLKG